MSIKEIALELTEQGYILPIGMLRDIKIYLEMTDMDIMEWLELTQENYPEQIEDYFIGLE